MAYGDNISRQAALDALNHELRCGAVINQCGLEVAYEVIEGLPPAEPELVAAGIGRRIKERLNELGMTKHELAIACGIDDKKIKLYTIGYTTPKAQTCEKIAEALECSVEWLLGTGGKENESVL